MYLYVCIRPQPGVELWGATGYERGTMTLEAEDGSGAKPDIWLTMAAVGGRSSLIPSDASGFDLDLTADALLTRTGAKAAGSLRDAVEANTTRLRISGDRRDRTASLSGSGAPAAPSATIATLTTSVSPLPSRLPGA